MKYTSTMELVTLAILSLTGLTLLLIQLPVSLSTFNYPPLFFFPYLLAIVLPGYTFLSFIKPEVNYRTRLEVGIPLSLVLMFLTSLLFIFLGIPRAFTYAVLVLMILSLIMVFSSYLAEKIGPDKLAIKTREPSKPEPIPIENSTGEMEAPEEMKKTIITRPPHTQTKLKAPAGEVEVIIPNHVPTQPEAGKNKPVPNKKIVSPEKPALVLPWIERQKELDRQKK